MPPGPRTLCSSRFGVVSLATYRSGQPSPSKSAAVTPSALALELATPERLEAAAHIQVVSPIIVEIADRDAHPIHRRVQPGARGHVLEGTRRALPALIVIERGQGRIRGRGARQGAGIDEEQVQAAVAVVV